MERITQDKLKELLHYNPDTGIFTWLVSKLPNATIGGVAGHKSKDGYIYITVDSICYCGHRLAWLYEHGYFPENGIDHKDRIKHHNWISNIREASQQCNMRNTDVRKDNTSGVVGVCWHKASRKWVAQTTINGIHKYLGCYDDFDEAVCVRYATEQCLDWHKCNTNSSASQYVKNNIQGERNET